MRIPVKPITRSGVKSITVSGQADHLSERIYGPLSFYKRCTTPDKFRLQEYIRPSLTIG